MRFEGSKSCHWGNYQLSDIIGKYALPGAQGFALLSSNHFEKLRGKLASKHSIRVNKQWRLVFAWAGERGEAQGIYLDNHDYR
ncbi:MAG: type II toxin-antitoxin system RelE/ParE family toxin [Halioglobus sp.]|nr:type II toxin-antitoxin system RelE/ParE family toxin [Halioglobus sp.]